jgi:predicted transcriptional regulator
MAAEAPTSDAPSSKKAEIIARLRRAKGVSLPEIQKLTGWQKHTVRGFISVLGSKSGLKIISTRNDSGERTYRVAK